MTYGILLELVAHSRAHGRELAEQVRVLGLEGLLLVARPGELVGECPLPLVLVRMAWLECRYVVYRRCKWGRGGGRWGQRAVRWWCWARIGRVRGWFVGSVPIPVQR